MVLGVKNAVLPAQICTGFFNTRELKVKNGTMTLNLGAMLGENRFRFATGLRMEFGRLVTKTRVYGESSPKEKMEQIGYSSLTLKFGPVVKIFGIVTDGGAMITGSIYYVWSVFKENVTMLDVELNNSSYVFSDGPQFDLKANTFGFNVNFGFGKMD